MAIVSAGYDGTVDEAQWAKMISKSGSSEYGVVGADDFKVSVSAGDRAVSVAAGKAWGFGVYDESDSGANLLLSAPATGSRWDLIVLRRDWQPPGGNTSVAVVEGTSVKGIPAGRITGQVGVQDDQPIALVRVAAGSTAVQEIVDLRCWARNGGVFVKDVLALGYLDSIGAVVSVGRHRYHRIIGANDMLDWLAETPIASDSGETVIAGNGTPQVTRSISYAPGRFTAIPIPVAVTSNPDYYVSIATRPNSTSFGVTVTSRKGTNFTGGVGVLWHATGI